MRRRIGVAAGERRRHGGQRVIASEQGGRAVADAVEARIAHVTPRDIAPVAGQQDDRGRHQRRAAFLVACAFDRILVDAPCSGTGTLARNPEIKWRLKPADLDDLHRRQTALLANARAVLAPGGLLVYSTCSLEPEENEAVLAEAPGAVIVETMQRVPGREAGDGFFAGVIKSEKPAND